MRIRERAVAWSVAAADAFEIDRINILQASRLAMRRAIERLHPAPDYLLIDAVTVDLPLAQRALIHGDALSQCIAAASILAKVERDACMREWDLVFPQYGLKNHKGYSTDRALEGARNSRPHAHASLQLLAGARAFAARGLDRLSAPGRSVCRGSTAAGMVRRRRRSPSGNGGMHPVEGRPILEEPVNLPSTPGTTSSAFSCSSSFALKWARSCIVFPWTPQWDSNSMANLFPWLRRSWTSSYFRGALSGLGLLNIYISLGEVLRFAGCGALAC